MSEYATPADHAAAVIQRVGYAIDEKYRACLLYTSPSPRDTERSRMPSSA